MGGGKHIPLAAKCSVPGEMGLEASLLCLAGSWMMDPRARQQDGPGAGERIHTVKDKIHCSKDNMATLNRRNGITYHTHQDTYETKTHPPPRGG